MRIKCLCCEKVFNNSKFTRYCQACWNYYFNVIEALERTMEENGNITAGNLNEP